MKYDVYIVVVGRFLQIATSILVLRLMTTRLDPSEMGKYSLILTITSFFALIFINPVGMYFNRRLHEWYEKGLIWVRFKQGAIYTLAIAAVAFIVILIGPVVMNIKYGGGINEYILVLLVTGSLIVNTSNQTLIPSFNMLEKRSQWAVFTLLTLWVGLFLSMLFTRFNGRSEFWILGQLTGMLVGTVVAVVPFRRLVRKFDNQGAISNWNINEKKEVLQFTYPIALAVGLNWIQFQSYRFIIESTMGLKYLGLFVAGYTLSSGIMGAFESTIMQYYYPIVYKKALRDGKEWRNEGWNEYASILFPLAILTALYVSFMSKPLTHILIAKDFSEASRFVIYGALTELGRILGNAYGVVAHIRMNTRKLILPQTIGALATVGLVPLMIFIVPNQGAGLGLVIASSLYVFSMHITMQNYIEIKFSTQDVGKIVLLTIFLLISGIVFPGNSSETWKDISFLAVTGFLYLAVGFSFIKKCAYERGK